MHAAARTSYIKHALPLAVLAVGLASPVWADEGASALRFTDADWDAQYVELAKREPVLISTELEIDVPAPAANDSEETAAELALLHEYAAAERTAEVIEKIKAEEVSYELPLHPEAHLDADGTAELESLQFQAIHDVTYYIFKAKKLYSRARPDALDPTIETVIANPGHPAYPSGHAAQSYTSALVLAYIDPEHAAYYKQASRDIARRREIAGVHYPSDSEAGRILAEQVFEQLAANAEFKTKMDKVAEALKHGKDKS